MSKETVPVAKGDGIGPEIMDAALHILLEAGAQIEPVFVDIGEKVYLSGHTSGIDPNAWDIIINNKVFYKAPITTPQGGGYKSLNVTIRKTLSLYANVRPTISYTPIIPSKHENMDVVIIRENEEDLYAGIEHRQTPEVVQCLKLISRPGCKRIIRYAFEYAKAYGRKKITCMTKDNIMKLTDGLFHKVFDEIALEYPDIVTEHKIIDIGVAMLADVPEQFDVVVTPNLYGDIASDVTAQVAGTVGIAPSANIGEKYAMFEAIHGSAPDIAGKGIANPSALLLSGVNMLVYLGQNETAQLIHNAWLKTIEDKIWTADLVSKARAANVSDYKQVSTKEFAHAVVQRLGKEPEILNSVQYKDLPKINLSTISLGYEKDNQTMVLEGVDIFIKSNLLPQQLGTKLDELSKPNYKLMMISNRGQVVYPKGFSGTFCTDHWRCRFYSADDNTGFTHSDIRNLLQLIEKSGLEWIKLENLYLINGKPAYTLGQGQ